MLLCATYQALLDAALYYDIRAGVYQVVILSIEAFTDTSRLLPIIESPQPAKNHRQAVAIDEVH
jgi:hypothetical protein